MKDDGYPIWVYQPISRRRDNRKDFHGLLLGVALLTGAWLLLAKVVIMLGE